MKKVQLQVALPGGVTLSLRVDRDISLSTIRQYIYEVRSHALHGRASREATLTCLRQHTGLAPNEQALYHGDIALAGNRPLEDYAFAQYAANCSRTGGLTVLPPHFLCVAGMTMSRSRCG